MPPHLRLWNLSHLIPTGEDLKREVMGNETLENALLELRQARLQLATYKLVHDMNQTRHVCAKCRDLSFEGIRNGRGYEHWKLQKLKQSATIDRCKFCLLLWTAVCQGQPGNQAIQNLENMLIYLQAHLTWDGLDIVFIGPPAKIRVRLGLATEEGSAASSVISRRIPALDPVSRESLSVLNGWLHGCIETHDGCPSNTLKTLPTRVVDVGPQDGSIEPYLVADTSTYPLSAYICLTHCWGGIVPIQTTKGTIEERKQGILLRDLPQTFRDAVLLTRKLGFRYLWIDSLCIVQDDKDDWARESARMGAIYRDSVLTISGMSAQNSTEGFLGCRDPNATATYRFDIDPKNPKQGSLIVTYPDISEGVNTVGSRGWCYQELLLPPRVVQYSMSPAREDREMIWDCQTRSLRENGTSWANETKRLIHQDAFFRSMARIHAAKMDEEVEFRHKWRHIITEFTKRHLSFASDKLPALSGIAATLGGESVSKRRYLAGLWDGDLIHDLLWMAPKETRLKRPAKPRAPSWSWASVDGSIRYQECWTSIIQREKPAPHFTARVVEIRVEPENQNNPYGSVKEGGFILMSGPLLRAKLLPNRRSKIRDSTLDQIIEFQDTTENSLKATSISNNIREAVVRFDQVNSPGIDTVWCLVLGTKCGPTAFDIAPLGLVLFPANEFGHIKDLAEISSDADGQLFKRVGIFGVARGRQGTQNAGDSDSDSETEGMREEWFGREKASVVKIF